MSERDDYQVLLQEIEKRAKNYTPEWRFSADDPDIGSALALVYAHMFTQTMKKLTRVPLKNRITFLNSLGADLLPAVPSEGYVQFFLVNEEVDGTPVPVGTVVSADSDEAPDGQVSFETLEAIYVTPAVLSDVYLTHDRTDRIIKFFDRQEKGWSPFVMFSERGENEQKHEFYFSHDLVFAIQKEADIELTLLTESGREADQRLLRELADPSRAVFEYATGKEDWEVFSSVEAPHGYLKLHKEASQPAFARRSLQGVESCWIRLRVREIACGEKLNLGGLMVSSKGKETLPDTIYGVQEERDLHRCLPFGERLDLYQEVYFGSEEVLSKKGAEITLSFRVDFARVPLDTNESRAFNWEWVMNRSDFKPDLEFDVTIESIIWEYFNGTGWTRLFSDTSYDRIFSANDGNLGQYATISFTCPNDIEKILINATETFYIRARIIKINNLYKLSGQYVLPVIENISMKYEYQDSKEAKNYLIYNNLEMYTPDRREGAAFAPFIRTGTDTLTEYFGFETPPVGSPVKILFDIAGVRQQGDCHLFWEYWNGFKWKNMNPVDETGQLSKTGMITFTGNPDMTQKRLFGKERYWFRVRDAEDFFAENQNLPPVLNNLFINTTKVKQIQKRRQEYFQMEIYQADQVFPLQERNVYEAEVYVDEFGQLSERELETLKEERKLVTEYDANNLPVRMWVKWEWKPDFYFSGAKDRHFVIHRLAGKLQFGDGIHGRIPSPSQAENIRISYIAGGGEYTNLGDGTEMRMERSLGFISEVYSRGAMTGGCDEETLVEGIRRNTLNIRHQNRAVTEGDYEELALCAARDIQKVKCFSGYDDFGRGMSGAVTLAVLQKNYKQGRLHFAALRERILKYMRERVSPFLLSGQRLFIVQPDFVEIRLYVELTVEDFNQLFRIKGEILERLERFLDPVNGRDGAGWEIGSFPNAFQIQNTISDIEGIVYIGKLVMNTFEGDGEGGKEIDMQALSEKKYLLPISGEHEIVIHV